MSLRLFSTEEKDQIRADAVRAYQDCYGEPTSDEERYYVMKGIEAMAAVLYTAIEDKLRD